MSKVYGVRYCDELYGQIEYGIYSSESKALEGYERAKQNIMDRYKREGEYEEKEVELYKICDEEGAEGLIMYSYELDKDNEYNYKNESNYPQEWDKNEHIKILKLSMYKRKENTEEY